MDNVVKGIKSFPWYVRWLLVAGLIFGSYKLAEMIFGTFFSWLGHLGMVLVPLVSFLVALNIFKGGTFEERKEEATASWTSFLSNLGQDLLGALKESTAKMVRETMEAKPA